MDDTWVNDKPSMILRLPDERSETDNISRGTSISSYSRQEDKEYTMQSLILAQDERQLQA